MDLSPKQYVDKYLTRLDNYVNTVIDGTRTCGKRERQAVERFLTFKQKYEFRPKELTKRLKFISLMKLPLKRKGVQQMVLADWQIFLIANIYCFYHPGTEDRVIQQVVISAAGKQGKTSLTCILSLMNVLLEDAVNNNIVILSVTTKQSQEILKFIKDSISYSDELSSMFKVLHSTIVCKANGAKIMVFTNEAKKLQGLQLRNAFHDEYFLCETEDEVSSKDIAFEKCQPNITRCNSLYQLCHLQQPIIWYTKRFTNLV